MNIPLIQIGEGDGPIKEIFKRAGRLCLHLLIRIRSLVYRNPPHLAGGAVRWIRDYLNPSMVCYEWGSGGSTVFFAEHARSITSVEHDKSWHDKVSAWALKRRSHNLKIVLVLPDGITGRTAPEYFNHILTYPDNYFDLVLVDGRMRLECAHNARSKVKPGGVIVYDDSHRESGVQGIFAGWNTIEFTNGVTRTSIFIKP